MRLFVWFPARAAVSTSLWKTARSPRTQWACWMSCDEERPVVEFPTISGEVLQLIIEFMREFRIDPYKIPLPAKLPKEGLSTIFRSYFLNLAESLKPNPLQVTLSAKTLTEYVLDIIEFLLKHGCVYHS